MDSPANQDRPACFGVLDQVFPMGPSGLREVTAACWDCARRVECLRVAVATGEQAEVIAEEVAGRSDGDGLGGFVRRWSRLKAKNRKKGLR